MVRGDRIDNLRRLVIPPGDIGSDLGMPSLDLMVNRLSHIMEKSTALCENRIDSQLRG